MGMLGVRMLGVRKWECRESSSAVSPLVPEGRKAPRKISRKRALMLGPHSRRSPGERQRRCPDERAGPWAFGTIYLDGQRGNRALKRPSTLMVGMFVAGMSGFLPATNPLWVLRPD
jgi:hypothetical protein